jgi:hypothetical protein
MRVAVFAGILITYIAMLVVTGYLTFIRFPGMPTLATPQMVATLAGDPDFKADLLDDVKAARQRSGDLIKLAAHSFDVILGALLGFLSAVAATSGLTGGTRPSKQQVDSSQFSGTPDVLLQDSGTITHLDVSPDLSTSSK